MLTTAATRFGLVNHRQDNRWMRRVTGGPMRQVFRLRRFRERLVFRRYAEPLGAPFEAGGGGLAVTVILEQKVTGDRFPGRRG